MRIMNIYELFANPTELLYHDDAFNHVPRLLCKKFRNDYVKLIQREAVIAKDAACAYWYAKHILKGPFKAGEAAIAKDPMYAAWYAIDLLKGSFPTGEIAIFKNQSWTAWYLQRLIFNI